MIKRTSIYLIGIIITALGIALIIRSPFGTGPWDTVGVGMNQHFGWTIGTWTIITQGVLIFITAVIEKARPRMEAALVVVVRSWFLDIWFYFVLVHVSFPSTLLGQGIVFIVGVICVGVGIGIYIEAKFPNSPIDELMVAISVRFKLRLNPARRILELTGMFIGFIISGPVGVGTVIIALVLGNIIQLSNRRMKQVLSRFTMATDVQ